MTIISVSEDMCVLLPGKADNYPCRFFISRKDAFLVMCSQCGGRINTVHHVILGDSMLPMISQCTCDKEEQR
jgi:hypothetical protein